MMPDILTKEQRSYNMSMIRSSKTSPELNMKRFLSVLGFSYQPKVYGRPDFANRKEKIAIFIDGCFWHKCPRHYTRPKSNIKFWAEKIKRNVQRDKEVTKELGNSGWRVIRIWEHSIRKFNKSILDKR